LDGKQGLRNDERRASRENHKKHDEKTKPAWIDAVFDDLESSGYSCAAVAFPSAGIGAPHIRDRAYWVADAGSQGLEERERDIRVQREERRSQAGEATELRSNVCGFWANADWLGCRDGKFRPVEPGTSPLVDGAANRVGRLRGYGNAINAQAAKVFIESYMGV